MSSLVCIFFLNCVSFVLSSCLLYLSLPHQISSANEESFFQSVINFISRVQMIEVLPNLLSHTMERYKERKEIS